MGMDSASQVLYPLPVNGGLELALRRPSKTPCCNSDKIRILGSLDANDLVKA